ncbi:hypothetical protein EVAR_21714_1 [Eumeta japonica]|uniref:Uncharacterized protein n=1 Tax=Eumeta variegata TaxID=151549 RepID=A0A4C1W5F4_EUMVA|nr:hypothetical protein EVAR_21714_1 [Eumeta japonica]
MFVRMRTALIKVPCGSLDSVASTCDAPGDNVTTPQGVATHSLGSPGLSGFLNYLPRRRYGQVIVVVENDDQWNSLTTYSKDAIYEQHVR